MILGGDYAATYFFLIIIILGLKAQVRKKIR